MEDSTSVVAFDPMTTLLSLSDGPRSNPSRSSSANALGSSNIVLNGINDINIDNSAIIDVNDLNVDSSGLSSSSSYAYINPLYPPKGMVGANYPSHYHPYPSIDDEVDDLYFDYDVCGIVTKEAMQMFEDKESKVREERKEKKRKEKKRKEKKRKEKKRKGKERKGKERKGKERKGKERREEERRG